MVKAFKPKVRELKQYIKANKFLLCPSKSKLKKQDILVILNSFGIPANPNMEIKELKNMMKALKDSTCKNVKVTNKNKSMLLEIAKKFELARSMLLNKNKLYKVNKVYGYKNKPLYGKINRYLKKLPVKIQKKIKLVENELGKNVESLFIDDPVINKTIKKVVNDKKISPKVVANFINIVQDPEMEQLTEKDIKNTRQELENNKVIDVLNLGDRGIAPEFKEKLENLNLIKDENVYIDDELVDENDDDYDDDDDYDIIIGPSLELEKPSVKRIIDQTEKKNNPSDFLNIYTPEQYFELFGQPHPSYDYDELVEREAKNLYENIYHNPTSCNKLLEKISVMDPKDLFLINENEGIKENKNRAYFQHDILVKLIKIIKGDKMANPPYCTEALNYLDKKLLASQRFFGNGIKKKGRGSLKSLGKKAFKVTANAYRKRFCNGKSRDLLDGELHFGCHNFTGPGTRIDLPEVRNYPPYNDIDACSKKHDIDYLNANGNKKLVRKADIDVVNCYKKYPNENGYNASMLGINGKMKLENVLPIVARSILGELSGKGKKKKGKGLTIDDKKILKMFSESNKSIYNEGNMIEKMVVPQAVNYSIMNKKGASLAYENNRVKPMSSYFDTYQAY